MKSQKVLTRIKKLQALAGGSEGNEAEQAARRAMEMMLEHAVSQHDVDSLDLSTDPLISLTLRFDGLCLSTREERRKRYRTTSGWKRSLAQAVSDYVGLRASYHEGTPIWKFHGHQSDTHMAKELYGICAAQIDTLARSYVFDLEVDTLRAGRFFDPSRRRDASHEYRETAVVGLESKFTELTREVKRDHAEDYALVLDRRAKVSEWVDSNYTFSAGSGRGFGSGDGWNQDAYEAGRSLALHSDKKAVGGGVRGLIEDE